MTEEKLATKAPVIYTEKKIFHGGTIVEGDKLPHVFKVENIGNLPLVLTDITTDCSCTTVNYSREIQPGEFGNISVVFDTAGGSGETFKIITLHSNDPENPITVLEIGANIQERVSIEPDRIFFNGIKGTPLERTITINAPANRSFELKLLKSQLSDQIGFYVKKNELNSSYKIFFRNKAEKSETFRGRVFFKTNLKERPRITLPVYSKIVDKIQAIPGKVDFGKINRSHPETKSITVRSFDGKSFEIVSIDSGVPFLSTKVIKLKKQGIFRIEISPDLTSMIKTGKIETFITINMGGTKKISLKIPVTLELN